MPLSCLDTNGERIHAFDLSDDDWTALTQSNQRDRHLAMPCCMAKVVLKQSSRGLRFFSHVRVGDCSTADESEEHRQLKLLAVEAARANGWDAKTEVGGVAPSGAAWQADVLAQRRTASVAVEVQWSSQVDKETVRRQVRYKDSSVRALWLLRQTTFPISQDVPAACIGGNLRDGFTALLPSAHRRMTRRERSNPDLWRQALPMDQFLSAAFAGRLKWGVALDVFGDEATVEIFAAEAGCDKCGVFTDIITHIDILNPGMRLEFGLLELGEHPDMAGEVLRNLPSSFNRSQINIRYSRTRRRRYLSNGCLGCGQLFGDFYMFDHRASERAIATFPVRLIGKWRRLVKSHVDVLEAMPQWWVTPSC